MKSHLLPVALIAMALGSCNKKSGSTYVPQTEREEWKLTHKKVVSYGLPASGQKAYTSDMGFFHDFNGLSIYVRDTVQEDGVAARVDRYRYNYRVGWVLTGLADTTGINAIARAMNITYKNIRYGNWDGTSTASDFISYSGAAGQGRSVVNWSYNDTMPVKVEFEETGVTFPHDRRYAFDPKDGSLIKYGYTSTLNPASSYGTEMVRGGESDKTIKYVKKLDYRPQTGSLLVTDSIVYTKTTAVTSGALQSFFRRMARGISWWKTGNGYARMPGLSRDIPYYVYEFKLLAKEEHYHDFEDGGGLVKQFERTYAYETDGNGHVTTITVRYNGQLESEIRLTWELLKWME